MSIVSALRAVQEAFGHLPDEALRALSERMGVSLHRLQEVASFFPHFHRQPRPEFEVRVCRDMACHVAGAPALTETLQNLAETHGKDRLQVGGVSCLGRCDRAIAVCIERSAPVAPAPDPRATAARAVLADDEASARFDFWAGRPGQEIVESVAALLGKTPPAFDSDLSAPTASNEWLIDVPTREKLPPYGIARGFAEELRRDGYLTATPAPRMEARAPFKGVSYEGLKKELEGRYPASVCDALRKLGESNLKGMGGGQQPALEKWLDVLTASGPIRHVVANGDESEPGTFKDRELMIRAPHLIVEGVILAGLLLGAATCTIFVRHEYADGINRLRQAIGEATAAGVCGKSVLGASRSLLVDVFVSPGGYICGEQSALLEAMEDRRAEPRNRPPELATNGLRDCPTLVSNVETFAWLPAIVAKGGEWYAQLGASPSRGRRLFSISGDVARPGVYEMQVGAPLGELLKAAGGMRDPSLPLKAIAPSGPSGGFVPPTLEDRRKGTVSLLDLPLDIKDFREARVALGAGMVVYDASRNLAEQAQNSTEFYRNESCGKCVPCRVGSEKLVQIGRGLLADRPAADAIAADRTFVAELAETMQLSAICGLGAVAAQPLTTVLEHFPQDFGAAR